ncbi:uncharacterized protein LOC128929302 isoform X3 [Callithrix jacchus]
MGNNKVIKETGRNRRHSMAYKKSSRKRNYCFSVPEAQERHAGETRVMIVLQCLQDKVQMALFQCGGLDVVISILHLITGTIILLDQAQNFRSISQYVMNEEEDI